MPNFNTPWTFNIKLTQNTEIDIVAVITDTPFIIFLTFCSFKFVMQAYSWIHESQIESHRLKSSLYGGNRIAKTVVQIAI